MAINEYNRIHRFTSIGPTAEKGNVIIVPDKTFHKAFTSFRMQTLFTPIHTRNLYVELPVRKNPFRIIYFPYLAFYQFLADSTFYYPIQHSRSLWAMEDFSST